MSEFEVEKGIPAPETRGKEAKYPWKEMEVGDSFLITEPPKYIRNMASQAGRVNGLKFSVRTLPEGVRVWRVK